MTNAVATLAYGESDLANMDLGKRVAEARAKRMMGQDEFGALLEVSGQTIGNLENGKTKTLKQPAKLRKLMELIGATPEEFWEHVNQEPPSGLPPSVDPGAKTYNLPVWDLQASAAHWSPAKICELNQNDPDHAACIATGLFRLRIVGDCMAPKYPNGMICEFQVQRGNPAELKPNDDYVLCRSDNTCTFKRVVSADEETVVLKALNQKKYHGTFTVPTQEIVRVARYVGEFTPRKD